MDGCGAGPWEISNGALILPKAQLRCFSMRSVPDVTALWEFEDVVGFEIGVEPTEQKLAFDLKFLQTSFGQRVFREKPRNLHPSLKKWVGKRIDDLATNALAQGIYEYRDPNHHVTLSLLPGGDFLYQETKEESSRPGAGVSEVVSDHKFARWEVVKDETKG